jgi:hypothetical protein
MTNQATPRGHHPGPRRGEVLDTEPKLGALCGFQLHEQFVRVRQCMFSMVQARCTTPEEPEQFPGGSFVTLLHTTYTDNLLICLADPSTASDFTNTALLAYRTDFKVSPRPQHRNTCQNSVAHPKASRTRTFRRLP